MLSPLQLRITAPAYGLTIIQDNLYIYIHNLNCTSVCVCCSTIKIKEEGPPSRGALIPAMVYNYLFSSIPGISYFIIVAQWYIYIYVYIQPLVHLDTAAVASVKHDHVVELPYSSSTYML